MIASFCGSSSPPSPATTGWTSESSRRCTARRRRPGPARPIRTGRGPRPSAGPARPTRPGHRRPARPGRPHPGPLLRRGTTLPARALDLVRTPFTLARPYPDDDRFNR